MTDAASNSVPRRKLGSQGLEVSSLGLGANALPSRSEDESISLIKHAFQQGITFLDSANIYGNGASEIVIGKALKDLPRDRVQIATKCGFYRDASTGGTRIKGEPEYIRKCCEESLERLGTEYIDLYYQHRPDTSVPIEKTVGALKSLVEEGKVKYIGLSEVCANDIRRAHAVHPITAIQLEWSLWTRDVEEDILPVCRELGIGIVVYSPLGRGFFAGKGIVEALDDNDYRKRLHPRFQGDNFEKNKHFYEKVSAIAQKHGCTPAQLSLAWLLHRGEDIVPIPGTTKVPNLDENIGSVFVKLQPQEVAELSALPLSEIQGPRTSPLWINSTYNVTPETPALEI